MWSTGGVAPIGYTSSFYPELAPAHLAFALAACGVMPPVLSGQSFAYGELGCGQGLTSNMLAALMPQGRFTAIDLLPEHMAGASSLAQAARLDNVAFACESFAEFAARPGPPLDIIALHGIWTWVDQACRDQLIQIVAQRLKPGGALFVSYNCLPGWGPDMPVRALLLDAVERGQGDLSDRIDRALDHLGRLVAQGGYFAQVPSAARLVESLRAKPAAYIAHEYLNRHWTPFTSARVAADLAAAGVEYCASATLLDHLDGWQVASGQVPLPAGDETLRDVLTGRRFRRDLFVKAPRRLDPDQRRTVLGNLRFVLTAPLGDIPETVTAPGGDRILPAAVYGPLSQALAAGPVFLRDLPGEFETVVDALLVLTGLGLAAPSLEMGAPGPCQALNHAILNANRESPAIRQLAAPHWGTAVMVDILDRLFLLAEMAGEDGPALAWEILRGRGKRLRRSGEWLEGEDNLVELRRLYDLFVADRRPLLQGAGIA